MNIIFIIIDSLNRHFLKVYGQPIEIDVKTPNLDAFAQRAAVFDRHYCGSLPCMPARREIWTGVQEFLWRPWGPIEPFDRPFPRVARDQGYITQLITDHFHFFQHGSHGYFEDFHGFEFIRGHEYDAWKTWPRVPDPVGMKQLRISDSEITSARWLSKIAYLRNVHEFVFERDFFAPKVFTKAAEWIEKNHDLERFVLVIDSFDVHEPFHVPEPYASMYTDEDPRDPELTMWPMYGRTDDLTERQVQFVRAQYAGKLTMVDRWFGRFLERLDDFGLWDNTMVIVTSDHGHYLGEHGWIGKPYCPVRNVLAHTPLMIYHPEGVHNGGRIDALTSAVDIYATILETMGVSVHEKSHSRSLIPLLTGKTDFHREWAIYGYWGQAINITDGRYTYLHGPNPGNQPLYCYSSQIINTSLPFLPIRMPKDNVGGRWLPYTDATVWRWPVSWPPTDLPGIKWPEVHTEAFLYDVERDLWQNNNLTEKEPDEAARLRALLKRAMNELEAPEEQYQRLGL